MNEMFDRNIYGNGKALGTLPSDKDVCASLCDEKGDELLETYVYEVGFFRFNWHTSMEIMLVLQGHLKAYVDGSVFDLYEDDFLVINPNAGHASILQTSPTIAMVLHISQEYLEELCGSLLPVIECHSTCETRNEFPYRFIRSCMAGIYLSLSSGKPYRDIFAKSQTLLLFSALLHNFSYGKPTPKEQKLSLQQKEHIYQMIKYINRNFREKISLNDLAELSQMNLSYVSTYFKAHVGINYHEYLIRKRLVYAAYLLHNTEEPVLDIALDAGFPDVKALNQSFKKYFNISPKQYRRGLLADCDASAKHLFPVRLKFSNEFVQKKLSIYLKENFSFGKIFTKKDR